MTGAILAVEEDKFNSVARQMSKWVDQVLGPTYHKYCPAETWKPSINIYEDRTHYCVVVDLAGVSGEEIDLRVAKGVLLLGGQRAVPEPPEPSGTVRLHLMEIDHGRFCREVKLPDNAEVEDADAVQASYRGGYLWITIPKKNA
jgi:HSP20 family molecular chaperone IbpA